MIDILISGLKDRFLNIDSSFFSKKTIPICIDYDASHSLLFNYVEMPVCNDVFVEHVVSFKGVWGVYEVAKDDFRVVHIPSGLTVYKTCSEDSAYQLVSFLNANADIKSKKVTKTLLNKIGVQIRKYRPVFDTIYFSSGLNVVGEYLGFATRDMNIGVAITYYDSKTGKHRFMNQKQIDYLRSISVGGMPNQKFIPRIFVDSGAFSVGRALMKYEAGKSKVKPEDLDFQDVLNRYKKLVEFRGNVSPTDPSKFFFVAPDVIANPQASLNQLSQYKGFLDDIIKTGAHLIVPMHDSPNFPLWKYDEMIEEFFGKGNYIVGIPTVKGVTKLHRFIEFLKKRKPKTIHFLGMGYTGKYYTPFSEAVKCYSPHTQIFLDAVRLTALIGRAKAKKGESLIDDYFKIRGRDKVYTRARDKAEKELEEENFLETVKDVISLAQVGDELETLISLEKKLRINLDDIDEFISGGETNWMNEYLPESKPLQEELFSNLNYFANFDEMADLGINEVQIMKDIIAKEPSVAVEITDDILRYKYLLENYPESRLEILSRLGKYNDYLGHLDKTQKEIDEKKHLIETIDNTEFEESKKELAKVYREQALDKIKELEEARKDLIMQFDHYESDHQGIWNDWFWGWYKTFPHKVIKELRNSQAEKLAKNEFYAEKTRRAIQKLSDRDLAKIK